MKRKSSLFYRYMLTYMAVSIVIMLIFGVFIYRSNTARTREALDMEFQSAHNASATFLDGRLSSLYDLAVVLQARNTTMDIQRLDHPAPPDAVPLLNTYSRELTPYTMSDRYLQEMTLYFSSSRLFVSSTTVGQYPDAFYDTYVGHSDMAYDAWRAFVAEPQNKGVQSGTDRRTGRPYIDVLQDLPNFTAHNKATLIVRFDIPNLLESMNILVQEGIVLTLRTHEGAVIYTTDPVLAKAVTAEAPLSPEGQPYSVMEQKLPSAGWSYQMLVPERLYRARERDVLRTILLLCAAILTAGALMSLAFSFYSMAPFRALLRSFGGSREQDAKNEYTALQDNIHGLVTDNRTLQLEMEKQLDHARWSFAERLFKGQFLSREERDTMARYADILLDAPRYLLAVFELTGYNQEIHEQFLREMDLASALIADFCADRMEPGTLVHKADFGRVVLLYPLDREDQAAGVREEILGLKDRIHSRLGFPLRCIVGAPFADAEYISTQYYILVEALEQTEETQEVVIAATESRQLTIGGYYYPTEIENRILGNIAAGNAEEARGNLRQLIRDNQEKYKITMPGLLYFIYALKCTMIRARSDMEPEDKAENERLDYIIYLEKYSDLDTATQFCDESVAILCGVVNRRKGQRSDRLVDGINAYIAEHYRDDQLSVSGIAATFLLAENYLSYFYKSNTGENLSSAIEQIRMKAAAELLQSGKVAVKDVGAMTGYQNSNTFYKAFKRCYGISPKGYSERTRNSRQ